MAPVKAFESVINGSMTNLRNLACNIQTIWEFGPQTKDFDFILAKALTASWQQLWDSGTTGGHMDTICPSLKTNRVYPKEETWGNHNYSTSSWTLSQMLTAVSLNERYLPCVLTMMRAQKYQVKLEKCSTWEDSSFSLSTRLDPHIVSSLIQWHKTSWLHWENLIVEV